MKKLALIILNWNGAVDTIECLKSLFINKELYDIYLLDNASMQSNKDDLISYLKDSDYDCQFLSDKEFLSTTSFDKELMCVQSEKNLGFALGNNFIGNHIYKLYKYLMLLNNDTIIPEQTIKNMLNTFEEYQPVAMTCDIRYNYDRSILWNAGGVFKWYGDRKYYSQNKIDRLKSKRVKYIKAEYITGCALFVDCNYIEKYGLLTDQFFHGEEDYNFCYNIKKRNLQVGVDLSSTIFHKVGQSINRVDNNSKCRRSDVVHYVNRVIDYKNFYNKPRWVCWRTFYLFLISIKRRLSGYSSHQVKILKKKVLFYSNNYDNVKYDVFQLIMNDDEII